MNKRDIFLIELEATFNIYCRWAISELSGQKKKNKKNGGTDNFTDEDNLFFDKTFVDQFLSVSEIPDADLNKINVAISRTGHWLKDYQYKYALNNAATIGDIRKAIDQLGSIYKISFAYPDNATKRAIKLRPLMSADRSKTDA
jgi:hypothetical protein